MVKPVFALCLYLFGVGLCLGDGGVEDLDSDTDSDGRDELTIPEAPEMAQEMAKRLKRYPEHLDPHFVFWRNFGECPSSVDGSKQHFCPSPTPTGRWICVDDYQLCDGVKNCPKAEDEAGDYCLFFRALRSQVAILSKTISALKGKEDDTEPEVVDNFVTGDDNFVNRHHRQSGWFQPVL